MDGVKTAIIGFIFVCIVLPHIIKNRNQYYLGLVAVMLSMVFQMLAMMFIDRPVFVRFCHILDIMLQMAAILILVMAAGGLSARQLAGDMSRAIEVMRRGEETSEVLIKAPGYRAAQADREESRERVVLDDDDNDPLYDPKRFNPAPAKPADSGAIPVEGQETDRKQ